MASKRIARLDILPSATALSTRAKYLLPPCLSHSAPHTRTFHVFREVAPLRKHRRELLLIGDTVGLVPTMGALHAGHLSLARQAAAENSRVFVSIYVNPTQFGVNEDLDSYPKTWDTDTHMLEELDKELSRDDSTLPGKGSFVTITPLGDVLEGRTRPVFMRGVATVCTKLFNIVEPEQVFFGQKDVQQTVVIKRMVQDFHINTKVRIVPTEREPDGLAMSSRNGYLGERRRKIGVVLSQALRAAEAAYRMGKCGRDDILALAWDVTNRMGMEQDALSETERAKFEVDYISLAGPETLDELEEVDASKGAILSGAIKMLPLEATRDDEKLGRGNDEVPVRLIDNIILAPQK
ncbi:pantoate-beta-alanine ligase [Vermiconidia calcicola]|uniref:Pantoate-beta-alanine ligase n=1 Tax=Vermiconidia calcicola TaxID=1690605 RepID=A0ACC3MZ42_9PEZI|nr:pantoate-beta-alanine ligase [Vermiconidia calcicola]